jgi:hypothetical protein
LVFSLVEVSGFIGLVFAFNIVNYLFIKYFVVNNKLIITAIIVLIIFYLFNIFTFYVIFNLLGFYLFYNWIILGLWMDYLALLFNY